MLNKYKADIIKKQANQIHDFFSLEYSNLMLISYYLLLFVHPTSSWQLGHHEVNSIRYD